MSEEKPVTTSTAIEPTVEFAPPRLGGKVNLRLQAWPVYRFNGSKSSHPYLLRRMCAGRYQVDYYITSRPAVLDDFGDLLLQRSRGLALPEPHRGPYDFWEELPLPVQP